tara:strand:+ start:304813 stop:305688 length:876 start_codon:yes stop_codon:yes gene_type:complete
VKQLDTSPINNGPLVAHLTCKDYSVSNETFNLVKDETTDLLVTSPRPNDADLDKYYESESYISHSDTRKSIFDKLYQLVRNYTLGQKVKLMASFEIEEKSILDIGAGTGDFLRACKKANWEVNGVEPNVKARTIANEKLGLNLKEKLDDLGDAQFDVITMWHVLEHVPNLTEYTKQLNRLLKPSGTLVVAVPNHKSYDAKHYGIFWAAYDVPRHLWHFSQEAMKRLFEAAALKVVQTLPMKFDSYYVSLLSEKYKHGKMNALSSFYIGLKSNLRAKQTSEYSSLIYIIKKD